MHLTPAPSLDLEPSKNRDQKLMFPSTLVLLNLKGLRMGLLITVQLRILEYYKFSVRGDKSS